MRHALAACLMVLAASAAQSRDLVEIIELRYRTAQDVIPLLRPLLPGDAALTGMGSQLVIRADPARIEEIRRVLESVDRLPRRLLITVRQDSDLEASRDAAAASVDAGSPHGRVIIQGSAVGPGGQATVRRGDDRVSGRVTSSRSASSERGTQQIQVMEGGEALIQVGQRIGIPERTVVQRPGSVQIIDTVREAQASTGFRVRPRLSGDRVILDIAPQTERFTDPASGATSVQRVATQVSGRLGEWIELGGLDTAGGSEASGVLARSRDASRDQRRVLVKVEELP